MGIVLTANGQRAEVSPHGAALMSWVAGGAERLSYYALDDPSHAFDGAVLMPWPNRRRDGPMHGYFHDVEWTATHREDHSVTLRYEQAEATYTLDDGLTVELAYLHGGDQPMRFGCGQHPYFAIAADDMDLDLPARSYVPVDDDGLPTGPPEPVGELPAKLDTCFTDFTRPSLRVNDIVVWFGEPFAFAQVYTGENDPDPARRRTRIAIEPMTCAPDAFNTGLGLTTLQPGERFSARWGLTLSEETR